MSIYLQKRGQRGESDQMQQLGCKKIDFFFTFFIYSLKICTDKRCIIYAEMNTNAVQIKRMKWHRHEPTRPILAHNAQNPLKPFSHNFVLFPSILIQNTATSTCSLLAGSGFIYIIFANELYDSIQSNKIIHCFFKLKNAQTVCALRILSGESAHLRIELS